MHTVSTEIGSCLNYRSILTPHHFLIGVSLTAIPEPNLAFLPQNTLSHWQHVQQIIKHFWGRWMKEYLTKQQQRAKWRVQGPNVKRYSLVLICCKLDRVKQLHLGKDRLVRRVILQTAQGKLKRAISQLCPLPEE
ncbi:hypothetical protein PR048_002138 [Dryococelus australis]|uniref:DUF5641 domain-containing protein n=1 Tax=Dryococelus australis TaxID=614101 RepID=A0ABQ9IJD2_9NEOP|nr:hypothetical protein PR048_002138 [Dryococelus australis]